MTALTNLIRISYVGNGLTLAFILCIAFIFFNLAAAQSGTGATVRTVPVKSAEEFTAEDFGAVGNGVVDDTEAINEALTARAAAGGGLVRLGSHKTYLVSSRISIPSLCGLIGDGTPRIYATALGFSNTDTRTKYTSTSTVIDTSGLTSSPYTPNYGNSIEGIIIQSEVSGGRSVDALVARNVAGLRIANVEIYGFPVSRGIRVSSAIDGSIIENNYIHDFTSNTTGWAATPQITAIEVDDDRVNNVYSDGIQILNNRINDITLGAAAIAAYNYQTDGIHIAQRTALYVIHGNTIDNVGEGVDSFGRNGVISGNKITNAYHFGIKLIHGASHNAITGNTIKRAGMAGIILSSSNILAHVDGNVISYNTISEMDPNSIWAAAGSAALRADGNATTYQLKNNVFVGNILDPGSNVGYAILRASEGINNQYIDNQILSSGSLE